MQHLPPQHPAVIAATAAHAAVVPLLTLVADAPRELAGYLAERVAVAVVRVTEPAVREHFAPAEAALRELAALVDVEATNGLDVAALVAAVKARLAPAIVHAPADEPEVSGGE